MDYTLGVWDENGAYILGVSDDKGRTLTFGMIWITRQSKQCGFSIYIFDNSKSKSMVRLVRSEKMALSGLVFARKIARMILIQNI